MTKKEFINLVIAYGANGTSETESYTDKQQSIVAQAWAALIHAEETYGNKDSEEYSKDAEEAAEAYYDDFYNAQEVIVNGQEFELGVVLNYIDKEIAEELHKDSDVCESEQAFVDAYIKAHAEKYGEEFQIN